MKKLLSLTLALIMALSCFAAAIPAQAANSADCVNINISTTIYNSLAQKVFNEINTKRSGVGYSKVKFDSSLTEIAEKRAAECLVYVDKNDDYRPNGDSVEALIPGNDTIAHGRCSISTLTISAVEATGFFDLFTSADYKSFKGVGLAVVEYSGVYVVYFVASASDTSNLFTNSSDVKASYTVQLNINKITNKKITGTYDAARIKYNLKTLVYAGGYYANYLVVSNDQLNYKSSNSNIVKMKGATAYFKNNGGFTVNSYNKSGKLIASYSDNVSGLKTYLKLSWKSAKSKKKKTISLSWQKNIIDATGYQIQYSTNKKFKKNVKTVNVTGKNSSSKTLKKLKRKKVYYVRVRACIDQGEGEMIYSSWSTTKKVKVK